MEAKLLEASVELSKILDYEPVIGDFAIGWLTKNQEVALSLWSTGEGEAKVFGCTIYQLPSDTMAAVRDYCEANALRLVVK
jgi:hypothetical protein